MKINEENVEIIIENFFRDIQNNFEDIKNLKNIDIEKVNCFIKKYFEKEETKLKYQKISTFINKEKNIEPKPDDLPGIYFVISLKRIEKEKIYEKFGYKDKNGQYIPIEEIGKFKHFISDKFSKKFDTIMNDNNDHTKILYIGKADGKKNQLYDRIVKQYMGTKYNHSGGRIIWQIEGVEDFYIAWIPVEDASYIETSLIQIYAYLVKKIIIHLQIGKSKKIRILK